MRRITLVVALTFSFGACGGEEPFDELESDDIASVSSAVTGQSLEWVQISVHSMSGTACSAIGMHTARPGEPCSPQGAKGFFIAGASNYCWLYSFECRPHWTCNGQRATIVGTAAAETINGTAGNDVIVGLGGNDTINGGGGNDTICGGSGKDTIYGNGGNDQLFGEGGDDVLIGGAGADVCNGGAHVGGDTAASCETVSSVP